MCKYRNCETDAKPGYRYCEDHHAQNLAYSRRCYATHKALGKCARCGKEPPLPGKTRCLGCSGEQMEINVNYYLAHGDEIRATMRTLRAERKAANLCRCGRPRKDGFASCARCLKVNARKSRRLRRKRIEKCLCARCGHQIALPGKTIGACHQKHGQRYKFPPGYRAPNANHPWRGYDSARVSYILWNRTRKAASATTKEG